jgi:hypothetical protein
MAAAMADPGAAQAIGARARACAEATMRFDHRMTQTPETYRHALARAQDRAFPRYRGNGL